jgi:hypothetical protein
VVRDKACFATTTLRYIGFMPAWLLLLSLPVALAIPCVVLALSAYVEQKMLSPRSLILSAVRARTAPEFTEQFVAGQFELLLRNVQR